MTLDSIVTKIRKLLRLASEANPSSEEAAAALAKAQQLMMLHEIEMMDVEDKPEPDDFSKQFIGEPYNRVAPAQKFIGSIVQEFFHIKIIYMGIFPDKDGTFAHWQRLGRDRIRCIEIPELTGKRAGNRIVQFLGRRSNILIAEYVYNFLVTEYERLWKKYQRETGKGQYAKHDYLAGLYHGLRERLTDEGRREEREIPSEQRNLFAIVRRSEKQSLDSYVHAEYPRLGHRRGRGFCVDAGSDSYAEGKSAGQNMNIRPSMNQGGGIKELPAGR